MGWKMMASREPELIGIERACRACRQQGATWVDFQAEHGDRIHIVASGLPTPWLRAEAVSAIYEHLFETWNSAMDGPPVLLPWDNRPGYVLETTPAENEVREEAEQPQHALPRGPAPTVPRPRSDRQWGMFPSPCIPF